MTEPAAPQPTPPPAGPAGAPPPEGRHPLGLRWTLHGDGRTVQPGQVVAPHERLSWLRTIGLGGQHVAAMFGATFLVPVITGFPPSTTLLFSGLGTIIFLLITRGRVPSYLGSSFAFLAPIGAATASGGMGSALFGVAVTGIALAVVGLIVQAAGSGWLRALMPPVVTGAIVALIGLNLAPVAKTNVVEGGADIALVTVLVIVLVSVATKRLISRLGILLGIVAGYLTAIAQGKVDFEKVGEAGWLGLPTFHAPTVDWGVLGLFLPVVLVLVAENIGHIRSVATMTGEDLDPVTGRALMADGVATTLAGLGGGSGTTTYAENIGVMAATKIYSTAAYWVAALVALGLAFLPKFGAVVAAIPQGVLGGAGIVLYGMIGMLGVKIWVENRVDFANPINLMVAGIALVLAIANFQWAVGDLHFEGIALGTAAVLIGFHLLRWINAATGAAPDPLHPLDR